MINSLEEFLKSENKISTFLFVCSNFNVDYAQQMLMFLFRLKLYKNYFDSKNAEMLFTYENENHVINLEFDKKLSYNFLYALLKKKFQVL